MLTSIAALLRHPGGALFRVPTCRRGGPPRPSGLSGAGPPAKKPPAKVARAALPPGKINYIFVIEFENEGYDITFSPISPARYLNTTLRQEGELLQNYYAIGHNSLDNYIAQVSGQAPDRGHPGRLRRQRLRLRQRRPGTPDPDQAVNPGQVDGEGCVYPRRCRRSPTSSTPSTRRTRPPTSPRGAPTSRTWATRRPATAARPIRVGHRLRAPRHRRHRHGRGGHGDGPVHDPAQPFRLVPLHHRQHRPVRCQRGPARTAGANGRPSPGGHLARDLRSLKTTPRFGFITPNLCNDGHDDPCAGPDSVGDHAGGLVGADDFLRAWVPLIVRIAGLQERPAARRHHLRRVRRRRRRRRQACCGEVSGPNTHAPGDAGDATDSQAPGGGQIGALLLNSQVHRAGLDRHHGHLQPLLGPAQLRGPARADQGRHRRRGAPGLCRRQGPGSLRDRRLPPAATRPPRPRAPRKASESVSRAGAAIRGSAWRSPRTGRPRCRSCHWSERPSRILAGIPSARAPGGITMLLGTTALAPTVAPLLTTAWCRITLPDPASEPSSSRQPSGG